MEWQKLAEAVLIPLVAFGLKWVLSLIGVELDDVTFNTIVAAVVATLIGLVFADAGARAIRSFRAR